MHKPLLTLRNVLILSSITLGMSFALAGDSHADSVSGTNIDFEDGSFSGWNIGSQTGTLNGTTITGNGTGVNIIGGAVTFNAPAHNAVGNPTVSGQPNPYYAPAVQPTTWSFSPYGSKAGLLQPAGGVSFDSSMTSLGLTTTQSASIKTMLSQQATASGNGSGNPTNAAWITRSVTLSANTVYTMAWNYIGTDYVPFNDGSITSLVYTGSDPAPTIKVNNGVGNYALLGFTNPGTGDYSTGTYGSTGWQISTYEVSVTGTYTLGFSVFNLGDTALSPVLLVDSAPGGTTKNGTTFGAVAPNNPNAPVVTTAPPTTSAPTTVAPTTTSATVPAPVVPLYKALINIGDGTCLIGGEPKSATVSASFIGYTYLPGAEECKKDGFVFGGWATSSATAPLDLPLLVDPSDGVWRYFVASDVDLVAVWSTVTTTTVPESPTTSATPTTSAGTLPNTGSSSETLAVLSILFILIGVLIFTASALRPE